MIINGVKRVYLFHYISNAKLLPLTQILS